MAEEFFFKSLFLPFETRLFSLDCDSLAVAGSVTVMRTSGFAGGIDEDDDPGSEERMAWFCTSCCDSVRR